jgi:phage RecT family recombinase
VEFDQVLARMEQHLWENPKLLEATPSSVFWAFVHAAEVGLQVGGIFGEAYVIPFKKKGVAIANFVPGYKGMCKLAYQSTLVASIDAYVIYEDDVFEVDLGADVKPVTYKPNLSLALRKDRGEVIATYTKIRLANGAMKHDVLPRWRMDEIRRSSPGASNPDHPWNLHPDEMYRKTGLRHALKDAPKSNELDRALVLDERAEVESLEAHADEPEIAGLDEQTDEGRAKQTRDRVQKRAEAAQLNAKPAITTVGAVMQQQTQQPLPVQPQVTAAPAAPVQAAAPAADQPPPLNDDPGPGEDTFD